MTQPVVWKLNPVGGAELGRKSGNSSAVPARSEGTTHSWLGSSRQTLVDSHWGEQRLGSGLRRELVNRPTKAPVAGSRSMAVKSFTWAGIGSVTVARKKYVPER